MNIVLIGTGNVATVLGRKFVQSGHTIVQVYGRNLQAAEHLAQQLSAEAVDDVQAIKTTADLYLLAVSDTAVEQIAKQLNLPGKIVAHTAGSVSIKALGEMQRCGVFYPLQSLKKTAQHLPDIPLVLDASDKETMTELQTLANSITATVLVAGDEERRKLHLAAVFCNNFVNHLYVLAEQYCRKESLDFSILLPLIRETASRLSELPPAAAQTGPAVRFDEDTLHMHRALLQDDSLLLPFYEAFTQSIQQLVVHPKK